MEQPEEKTHGDDQRDWPELRFEYYVLTASEFAREFLKVLSAN